MGQLNTSGCVRVDKSEYGITALTPPYSHQQKLSSIFASSALSPEMRIFPLAWILFPEKAMFWWTEVKEVVRRPASAVQRHDGASGLLERNTSHLLSGKQGAHEKTMSFSPTTWLPLRECHCCWHPLPLPSLMHARTQFLSTLYATLSFIRVTGFYFGRPHTSTAWTPPRNLIYCY